MLLARLVLYDGLMALTARDSGENMSDRVEEKELGRHRSLDKHDDACSNDRKEANDIQDADAVEDDVAWPSQRLGRESHLAVFWFTGFFGG